MKRLSLILACLLILGMFAGCASEPAAPTTSDTPATNDTPATETPVEEPAEEPVEEPTEEPVDEPTEAPSENVAEDESGHLVATGSVELPITAEPTHFSVWVSLDIGAVGLENMNDTPTWQHIQNETNIILDWTMASTSAKSEQFNLMLVSEDYDDAINNGAWLNDLGYYIEQDTLIDLRDLIETSAPHYTAVRNSDEVVYRDSMLDDGSIGAFYRILKSNQPHWFGLAVRDDLLNDLGLAIPTTLDEMESVLTAFKDAGVEAPLGFAQDGLDGGLLAAYNLAGGQMQGKWQHIGNEVKYAPVEPAMKDYLTLMNKWYTAGLIDQAFYGDGTMGFRFEDVAAGVTGMFSSMSTVLSMPLRLTEIEGFSLMPITTPMANEGETRKIAMCTSVLNRVEMASTFCITTACEDPETLVRFVDYFYTADGAALANWGLEDLTFVYDENGNRSYSELLLANDEGFTQRQAMLKYGMDKDSMPHLYDWEAQIGEMAENIKKIYTEGIWDANYVDEYTWPAGVSLTVEEVEASGSILGDVNTYVSEMIVKFIIGQEPLENFDAYVENIYAMGLQDAIDAYQTAYERYMARS